MGSEASSGRMIWRTVFFTCVIMNFACKQENVSNVSIAHTHSEISTPNPTPQVDEHASDYRIDALCSESPYALVSTPQGRRVANVQWSTSNDPHSWKRAYAFSMIAREFDLQIVPLTTHQYLHGSFLALWKDQPIRKDARILNDGTVDVLFQIFNASTCESVSFEALSVWNSNESVRLQKQAESSAITAKADLRAYVLMLMLDYITGNVLRVQFVRDRSSGAIRLIDNATAFEPNPTSASLDRILDRLRNVMVFPKEGREQLRNLSRERVRQLLQAGSFEEWLISPRTIIELDERRMTLLSLIEMRVAQFGEKAVLCL